MCDPDWTGTRYLVTDNGYGDALALSRIESAGALLSAAGDASVSVRPQHPARTSEWSPPNPVWLTDPLPRVLGVAPMSSVSRDFERGIVGARLERVSYFVTTPDLAWVVRPNLETADLGCDLVFTAGVIGITWERHCRGLEIRSSSIVGPFPDAQPLDVTSDSPNWRQCVGQRVEAITVTRAAWDPGGPTRTTDVLMLRFPSMVVAIAPAQYLDELGELLHNSDELSIAFGPQVDDALAVLGLVSLDGKAKGGPRRQTRRAT